ncbi:MAG TPA: uroporphyrinogen-III C-methyltransferase [Casimicrobiaceae bacterium]|nr:uroporphyrinogen-III C-methyltransferase [Casimicrobiaceae bacterium]
MPSGVVYLVGAGPGASDLLTLRAARILARADIVFHDALVHPDTIALAARAKIVAVGKRCGRHSSAQRFIDKQLVDAARRYDVVVRLKGGDPMLFGRAQEEIAALEAAGIAYEVVPGITAALAASASIGTSLTQRGRVRTFTFATPRSGDSEPENRWADAFANVDAGAIYMGLAQRNDVAERLIAAGKPASTPVAIVVDASLPTTRVHYTTLGGLADFQPGDVSGAALLLIGPQFHARAGGMMRDGGRALAASRHAPGVTPSAFRPRSRRAIRLARGASRSPCAA